MSTKTKNSVLKKLFLNETIKIQATNGKTTVAKSTKVFQSWLDSDFKDWGLDNPQPATKEMVVTAYEMIQNADFKNMFSSLSQNIDELCFTQHQIVEFCKSHKDKLHPNWATFFLFKENREYFVADVIVFSDGLGVRVYRFGRDYVWYAVYRHRVVVPATV